MPYITITNIKNGATLYEGDFASVKECIEDAVLNNASLAYADLRYKNLSHANLDDAMLEHADFTGSNLIGANLSEAALNHASFRNCSLESACLSFSSLNSANFIGSRFGGTYIEGANIDNARFSEQSCFHLDFITTNSMRNCLYIDHIGAEYEFSTPPVLLHGLPKYIVLIGRYIKIDHQIMSTDQGLKISDPLLLRHRHLIASLIESRNPAQSNAQQHAA